MYECDKDTNNLSFNLMINKNREFLAQAGIVLNDEDLSTLDWDNGIPKDTLKVILAVSRQKTGTNSKRSLSERSSNSSGTPPTPSTSKSTTKSDYQKVKNSAKKPRGRAQEPTSVYNRYEPLQETQNNPENDSMDVQDDNNNKSEEKSEVSRRQEPKTSKLPPIIIKNKIIAKDIPTIIRLAGVSKFETKYTTNHINIQVFTPSQYEALITAKAKNLEFYAFTPASQKTHAFVLKGPIRIRKSRN